MAAPTINTDAYGDALLVLATAGIVVPIVQRWRISPVLGYLAAGAVVGPFGLGAFQKSVPALYWVTVIDPASVSGIAELGVVFLLFLIGLELSFQRLMTMRRLVFGLGGLQVVSVDRAHRVYRRVCSATARPPHHHRLCLALSSTAIVIEVCPRQRRLRARGRTSFAILLAQDLAVVPLLLFVSILGAATGGSLVVGLCAGPRPRRAGDCR